MHLKSKSLIKSEEAPKKLNNEGNKLSNIHSPNFKKSIIENMQQIDLLKSTNENFSKMLQIVLDEDIIEKEKPKMFKVTERKL